MMADLTRADKKSSLSKFFGNRVFVPLSLFTAVHVVASASAFYLAENAANSKISSYGAAFAWVFSMIPFVGSGGIEPMTFWGHVIAIAIQATGLFIFAFWLALFGFAAFGRPRRLED